jgi:hypothetical protein
VPHEHVVDNQSITSAEKNVKYTKIKGGSNKLALEYMQHLTICAENTLIVSIPVVVAM